MPPLAVVACGALGAAARAAARGVPRAVEVHTLPASMHDRPAGIAPAVEQLCAALRAEGKDVVVAYAECGTHGALDDLCTRLGLDRLPGLHCYDLVAGEAAVRDILEEEPGTYLLTDFLVQGFERLVARSLGIDRRPDLVTDYFAHYRRIVWLTERPTPALEEQARAIAARLGLALVVRPAGPGRLGESLARLLHEGEAP